MINIGPPSGIRWVERVWDISKRARVLFTYYAYLILFVRIPCHLDTQIYVSFGPGL